MRDDYPALEPNTEEELEAANRRNGRLEEMLLRLTEPMEEHPEWYDGPCLCRLCKSYGEPTK